MNGTTQHRPTVGESVQIDAENKTRYRDTDGAAAYLGGVVPARTLQELRMTGGGPRWVRIGRTAVYRTDWLDEWFEARAVVSTSAERARKRA